MSQPVINCRGFRGLAPIPETHCKHCPATDLNLKAG
jgi:hypothetical protein